MRKGSRVYRGWRPGVGQWWSGGGVAQSSAVVILDPETSSRKRCKKVPSRSERTREMVPCCASEVTHSAPKGRVCVTACDMRRKFVDSFSQAQSLDCACYAWVHVRVYYMTHSATSYFDSACRYCDKDSIEGIKVPQLCDRLLNYRSNFYKSTIKPFVWSLISYHKGLIVRYWVTTHIRERCHGIVLTQAELTITSGESPSDYCMIKLGSWICDLQLLR